MKGTGSEMGNIVMLLHNSAMSSQLELCSVRFKNQGGREENDTVELGKTS